MQQKIKAAIQKTTHALCSVPRHTGERAFWFFLILFALGAAVSALLFYVAVWKPGQESTSTQLQSDTRFRQETFERILGIWAEQEARVEAADQDAPRNIFEP